MKSRKEQVERAVRFESPDYVPLFYFNGDRSDSDIVMIDVEQHFLGRGRDRSEWGFRWSRSDDTMGQPGAPILVSSETIARYQKPDVMDSYRFIPGDSIRGEYGDDRYYIASLGLTGFTIMSFLRGFSELLEDFYLDPETAGRIADIVFGTEERLIEAVHLHGGYDGIAFFDDWGTQSGMIVSPELWRDFFKPRYRRQFDLCHACGLSVYFHSCGRYEPIIPDLIESGVDFLNVSQPNVYDIPELGGKYAGQVCFVCPVSYQTTSISGSCDEIRSAVSELADSFLTPTGGLVGYVEEYESIGLSDENYRCCVDAWRSIGSSRSI
jgi:uroporphyrinogen decarboxylase